jgi:hypothetical protein
VLMHPDSGLGLDIGLFLSAVLPDASCVCCRRRASSNFCQFQQAQVVSVALVHVSVALVNSAE